MSLFVFPLGGSAPSYLGYQVLPAAAGAVDFDPSTANTFRVEAAGDVVLTPTAAFVVGVTYTFYFVQDATGFRTLAFDGAVSVDLPSYVVDITPETDPLGESVVSFRATSAAALEYVSQLGAEQFGFIASAFFSRIGEDILLQPSPKSSASLYWTRDLIVALGAPDPGSGRETGHVQLGATDNASPVPGTFVPLDVWCVGTGLGNDPPVLFVAESSLASELRFADTVLFTAVGAMQLLSVASYTVISPDVVLAVGGLSTDRRFVGDSTGCDVYGSRLRCDDVTTTPTVAAIDTLSIASVGAGAIVRDLPAASAALDGQTLTIWAGTGTTVTTNPDGADHINGAAAAVVTIGPAARAFVCRFGGIPGDATPGWVSW